MVPFTKAREVGERVFLHLGKFSLRQVEVDVPVEYPRGRAQRQVDKHVSRAQVKNGAGDTELVVVGKEVVMGAVEIDGIAQRRRWREETRRLRTPKIRHPV